MRRPGPVRYRKDIVARPFEALIADGGAVVAGDDQADRIPGRTRRSRALVDVLEIEIERGHHRPGAFRVPERPGAILATLGSRELAARFIAREPILGRAFRANFPEALVLPRARLAEARIERADGRHVRRVEPDGALRTLVDVAVPAHRRRQHQVAFLHLAAPAVDDGDGALGTGREADCRRGVAMR